MKTLDWTSERPEVLNLMCVRTAIEATGLQLSYFSSENNLWYKIASKVYQDEKTFNGIDCKIQIAEVKGVKVGAILFFGGREESFVGERRVAGLLKDWEA